MFITPSIFSNYPVIAAQSTREAGSRGNWFESLGIAGANTASSKQVHGKNILVSRKPQREEGYDSIITNVPGIFAMVSVADCTPVLIYDAVNGAVAAIHAGWRGTVKQITSLTVQKMKTEFGTRGEDCLAFIGACISYNHFEVGGEVAVEFDEKHKRFDPEKNKFFVDLKSANLSQLREQGLQIKNIEVSPYCTVTDNDRFFSYRKEKHNAGRMVAVIGIKSI